MRISIAACSNLTSIAKTWVILNSMMPQVSRLGISRHLQRHNASRVAWKDHTKTYRATYFYQNSKNTLCNVPISRLLSLPLFRRLTTLVTGRRQSSRGGNFFTTSSDSPSYHPIQLLIGAFVAPLVSAFVIRRLNLPGAAMAQGINHGIMCSCETPKA